MYRLSQRFIHADYVGKFYRALKRNSSVNFQRVCISDDPNVEADWVFAFKSLIVM